MTSSALLTDLYQLTMLAGYLEQGMAERPASFDLYFRTPPYRGSYAIFAGLEPALDYLENLRFTEEDLAYLQTLGLFKTRFLDFLRHFRFRGQVIAPPEGTAVFADTPLLSVQGSLAEAQFVETALLNIINFQTLVATKAARIQQAAGDATVLEFGLRRAQGPDGALSVARAACVGGVLCTSNVLAGKNLGLPLRGTHAHSWVMAFGDELAAFRAYASTFPDQCVLLVDTYDSLQSGVPNAIIVARELREAGHELQGIRLDSGDLAYLSRKAREMFDEAGFPQVRIVASNELDEFVIDSIREEGGRVDIYGVGTKLASCAGEGGGALGGVYKLVECDGQPRLKVTGDPEKSTLPGRKKLYRATGTDGRFLQDVVALAADDHLQPGQRVYAPHNPLQSRRLPEDCRLDELRRPVMEAGRRLHAPEPLDQLARRCHQQLEQLPEGCLRLINPHRYKVSISGDLSDLRSQLIERALKEKP